MPARAAARSIPRAGFPPPTSTSTKPSRAASLGTLLTQTLRLSSSYTFTKSEQKSGEFAGKPLNQLPRHLLNVGLDWNPTGQINGWTKVAYRGKESDSSGGASSGSFNQKRYALSTWAVRTSSAGPSRCMRASTTCWTRKCFMTASTMTRCRTDVAIGWA
ncbi:MAG: TonB-dependent receptor [Comamonas sp.]